MVELSSWLNKKFRLNFYAELEKLRQNRRLTEFALNLLEPKYLLLLTRLPLAVFDCRSKILLPTRRIFPVFLPAADVRNL